MIFFTYAVVEGGTGAVASLTDNVGDIHIPVGHSVIELVEPQSGWPATPPGFVLTCDTAGVLTQQDTRTLEQVRDDKWSELKATREDRINAPLPTPFGTFEAGPKQQDDIKGAVLLSQTLAGMGTPTDIDFTLLDNTTVSLTPTQMTTVGLLLGQRVQQTHALSRTLRSAVYDPAAERQDVDAIHWPA